MGIGGYNDESIHHDQKGIHFLPVFCRLSIKDVKLNTVPISGAAADPSSPRVSCMGQVKRNNRVTAAPTSITAAAHHHHHHKHAKPRKIQYFSTKTLLPNPATAAPPAARKNGSRSCRSNRDSRRSASSRTIYDQDCHKAAVDISKMDPPLPVVKRAAAPPGNSRDEVNLWRRRFDGAKKSMQIEPINLPNKRFPPPPTTV